MWPWDAILLEISHKVTIIKYSILLVFGCGSEYSNEEITVKGNNTNRRKDYCDNVRKDQNAVRFKMRDKFATWSVLTQVTLQCFPQRISQVWICVIDAFSIHLMFTDSLNVTYQYTAKTDTATIMKNLVQMYSLWMGENNKNIKSIIFLHFIHCLFS